MQSFNPKSSICNRERFNIIVMSRRTRIQYPKGSGVTVIYRVSKFAAKPLLLFQYWSHTATCALVWIHLRWNCWAGLQFPLIILYLSCYWPHAEWFSHAPVFSFTLSEFCTSISTHGNVGIPVPVTNTFISSSASVRICLVARYWITK